MRVGRIGLSVMVEKRGFIVRVWGRILTIRRYYGPWYSGATIVKQIWHTEDRHGQILALAFR